MFWRQTRRLDGTSSLGCLQGGGMWRQGSAKTPVWARYESVCVCVFLQTKRGQRGCGLHHQLTGLWHYKWISLTSYIHSPSLKIYTKTFLQLDGGAQFLQQFITHPALIQSECYSFCSHYISVGMAATLTSTFLLWLISTAAPVGPDRTTILWALYIQSEIITILFLTKIPPHDFILGVGIMAFNQNTLLMTSVWTDRPLRYHMSGMTSYVGRKASVKQLRFVFLSFPLL